MLMGTYQQKIDAKHRIFVPAKFREELGDIIIAAKTGDCISLFREDTFQSYAEELLGNLPKQDKRTRQLSRTIYANAIRCEVDKQGRILLSADQAARAKLDRDCVVIGVDGRAEIWSKQVWEEYDASASDNFEDLASDLAKEYL
ncbi:MAG: division/cell wall cluster transcriptional repressor MraZ [Erysipelotrichaceae bacterium]|jgi:MraZ protein|nr:division/cell wall cluster transcriptional repressor MraZ [Erysipelotrichaceae bacterium]